MNEIPVIIDCDPGADDAVGILLALNSSSLKILGITTACGNGTAEQTAENAARICGMAGRKDIRVCRGAEQPLQRSLSFNTLYCGEDGLCGTNLEKYHELISEKLARDFLTETLKNAEKPVTIISTGSLTNLAEALTEDPDIRKGIGEIVTASGYFGFNKKECRAEWNICMDPEAAEIVYRSGIPIRAVGLDVTCMLQDAYVEKLVEENEGKVRDFLSVCADYNRKSGLAVYSLLVDAMTAAVTICPELASYVAGYVTVHPEKNDAGQIKFDEAEDGPVKAAITFDYENYLKMIRGIMK